MNTTESQCNDIQKTIAVGDRLTDGETTHILNCEKCRLLQENLAQLDDLLLQDKPNLVPDGFVNRIMKKIPEHQPHPVITDNLFGQRMQYVFSQSRILQTALVGLGVAVGISHVIRFFLSIFITTMAAAS